MRSLPSALPRRIRAGIVRRFDVDPFVSRSIVQVTSGTLLAQLIAIAISPVLTRLYTPTEFGVYAAATTIVSLVLVVSTLRYASAIPLPPDDVAAARLVALSTVIALATSASLAIVLALFGRSIAERLGVPALTSVLWVVVIAQLGGALYDITNRWAVRARAYASIARTSVLQGVGMATAQIGLGALVAGPLGLVLGDAIGRSAGALGLARTMWREMRPAFAAVSWRGMREVAGRYRRFPLYSAPGAVLNTLNILAPTILLLALYGPATGGEFILAQRVGLLPIRLLGTSVAQVYVGQLARLLIQDRSRAYPLFTNTIRHLAIGGVVPSALLAVCGPVLFPIVFGEAWKDAGVYLALLAPTYFVLFVWNPISGTLDVLERQRLGMLGEAIGLLFVTCGVVSASLAGLGSTAAVMLLGVATSLATLLLVAITWREVRRASAGPRADASPAEGGRC